MSKFRIVDLFSGAGGLMLLKTDLTYGWTLPMNILILRQIAK